jgi:hypothetical protein
MIPRLSARDRRALAGGLGAFVVLGSTMALPRIHRWQAAEVARARAVRTDAPASAAEMIARRDSARARRRRAQSLERELLSGATADAITASLVTVVERLSTSPHVRISTVQPQPERQEIGSLTRVAVRISGETDISGLSALLRAIDESPHRLVVREMSINALDGGGTRSSAESLRFEMIVEAIAVARARAAAP